MQYTYWLNVRFHVIGKGPAKKRVDELKKDLMFLLVTELMCPPQKLKKTLIYQ